MAWERRGDSRYYYTARRVGGRVVKEYHGTGACADALHGFTRHSRHEKNLRRAELYQWERERRKTFAALDSFLVVTGAAVVATLTDAGYARDHSGRWRKRRENRTMLQITDKQTQRQDEADALAYVPDSSEDRKRCVTRALSGETGGNQSAADYIAALCVKAHPNERTIHAGDDLRAVIVALSRSMGKEKGTNRTYRALLENDADDLRGMLAQECGGSPSPLEAILVNRIVACRLALTVTESEKPTRPESLTAWNRTLDRVQGRYLAAVRTLAQVRRLKLPALALVQVNVQKERDG